MGCYAVMLCCYGGEHALSDSFSIVVGVHNNPPFLVAMRSASVWLISKSNYN